MKYLTENYTLPKYTLASKNVRMVNFIIDIILIKLISNTIFIVIDISIKNYNLSSLYNSLGVYQLYILNSIFMFFYYLTTEAIFSRSLSKFITKTIVVKKDGKKPSLMDF